MGVHEDMHYRLVSRIHRKPINELLVAVFSEVPLDASCNVKINAFDFCRFLAKCEELDPMPEPWGGTVSIEFFTKAKYQWESPTLEAATNFVKSNRYEAILVTRDMDVRADIFGLHGWSTVVHCNPEDCRCTVPPHRSLWQR